MFELTVISGPSKGHVFRSLVAETVIGRDEQAGILLDDRSVSRHHARIMRRGNEYQIEDLGSGNGTVINAVRADGFQTLYEGDLIVIGKITLRFHQSEESRPTPTEAGLHHAHATITMRDLQRELAAQQLGSADRDELQRARTDMGAIFRVGQLINGPQTTDELFPKILDAVIAELSRADRCSLLLNEDGHEGLAVQISQARRNSMRITDTLYHHSLAHMVQQQQQAMLIRDPGNDERFHDRDTIRAENIRSAICVPLQTQVGLRGVIYADCVTDNADFDEQDLKLLSVIGLQAAAAIDNARLYERLREEKIALADASAKIKAAQQRLIQSEKLAGVGELAAGIVHDIRNPIQIIMGHAEYLLDALRTQDMAKCDKAEFVESLQEMDRSVKGVNDTINQLLAFARQNKPELRTVRLHEIAVDTLRFLQAETNKPGIRVVSQYAQNLPPVLADAGQIKQVIVTIIMHSVQSMPRGGTLTVSSALLKDEGRDMVSLAIADTGAGLSPEHVARIFDPFFTTKSGEGSVVNAGLGLSVSYGIIESHGGRILVDSEPGKGSCFTILLPVHRVASATHDETLTTHHG